MIKMINNFLIISFIGKDDRLGLRINKDFFIHELKNTKNKSDLLVSEILNFINSHDVILDKNFTIIVNQGPGSFTGVRVAISIVKGLEISKKVRIFGYRNKDLEHFDQENVEILLKEKLIEKKLIKPIYLS